MISSNLKLSDKTKMINAISVDVEDWFCVYNFENTISKDDWKNLEYRAEINTMNILEIFDRNKTKGTFFILGWIAEKSPELIREIEKRGHEIGLHTYSHSLITHLNESTFEEEIEKGLNVIYKTGIKQQIIGFRAPSFTITNKTLWAIDILLKYNFKYDSSVFPFGLHPEYGISDAPISIYKIKEDMYEVPLTVAKKFGKHIPCSGGGYFRLYPYSFTKYLLKSVNKENRSIIFYIHPWEIDTEQPRVKLPLLKRFRHYNNIKKTEKRLNKLLTDFDFTTIKDMLKL